MANSEDRESRSPVSAEAGAEAPEERSGEEEDTPEEIAEAARALGATETSDLSAPPADIAVTGVTGGTAITGD